MSALEGIEHVIVLMLENRSFDCMFGKLYPKSASFEGLSGHETNPYRRPDGTLVEMPVWNNDGMEPGTACIPDPDPGELFADINMQLFGGDGTPTAAPPPMSGFIENYMEQPSGNQDPMAVMHYFTEKQVPVISALAKAFGICDQWYASAPCQTWPNRFFAHTATCGGHVDNDRFGVPFTRPTIFHRLQDKGKSWRVYFHDLPQVATLGELWLDAPFRFRFFDEFLEDARNGSLPNYSFIEPRYFTDSLLGLIPNDEHPPHNIAYGEQLIAAVYNAVRGAPSWKKSLLLITYDEHGGCYDHMPPPAAVPPDADRPDGFAFDRYGVRVPAVIVSPYIAPGSVVRAAPAGLPAKGPPYPFDHTSIIKTLRRLFDLGPAMTQRDDAAPDLLDALSLLNPENDGPASVMPTAAAPTSAEVQKRAAAPPNSMQRNLCRAAAHLPAKDQARTSTAAPGSPPVPPPATAKDAHAFVAPRVKAFLGR